MAEKTKEELRRERLREIARKVIDTNKNKKRKEPPDVAND